MCCVFDIANYSSVLDGVLAIPRECHLPCFIQRMFVVQLRGLCVGCVLKNVFVGCILYADDMILLCPSVKELQSMLDTCTVVANSLSLTFNASKSMYLAIAILAKMSLGANLIEWVNAH